VIVYGRNSHQTIMVDVFAFIRLVCTLVSREYGSSFNTEYINALHIIVSFPTLIGSNYGFPGILTQIPSQHTYIRPMISPNHECSYGFRTDLALNIKVTHKYTYLCVKVPNP
jgi:hypothetical protein